jgi:hypothetical protein
MKKKVCGKCKKEKYLDEFHKNSTKKDGLRSTCKECSKEYHKQHYLNNINKYRTKAQVLRDFLKSFVNRFKQFKGCKICKEKRYWVLEFHHNDRLEKTDTINRFVTNGNFKLLKKEIRKCDVLCSNCHKDLHYNENKK